MKLSAVLITRKIEQHLADSLDLSQFSDTLTIGRPVFLTDPERWPESVICIADQIPSSLLMKKIPRNTLVLAKHFETPSGLLPFGRCCQLQANCSLPDLFNELQLLYDHFDQWDAELQERLNREDTLQSLLDCSFSIFRNPLLLRRADFFLLAHSGIIDEQPALQHLIDPVNSYETLTLSKTDQIFLDSLSLRRPYFLPDYLSGSRELCCNLFDHGIFSYRLILTEELETISPETGPLLMHLAGYMQILLRRTAQNSPGDVYPLENLLCDIISQRQADYSVYGTMLADYGWFTEHRYCCMTVKMSALGNQSMTSNYLCRHFEEIIPGSCAFRYEGAIIVFINLTRYDDTIEGLLNHIIEFLRDSFLKTGISSPITGVADLRHCYTQARLALDYGSRYQTFRWLHKFEDITLQYFMECCLTDLPVHMVCSPRLMKLREHDRLHHSDYYNTLKIYLESHLNAVQSAKKLFIHRSTFLYRLEKIQELISVNFEDQEMLFYLMISYHILELSIQDSSYLSASEPSPTNQGET
ncbi:MAG: helix-turn-helix domain-containing protein [Lachnospiraceae bacterium]|nr:helix-turn-helix domain-containing protein [Lachnospiraceae bacterium]